jgi:hypothetical protein
VQNHQFTAQKLGKTQHQAQLHPLPASAQPVGKKRARREQIVPEAELWHFPLILRGIDPHEHPAGANRLAQRRARNKVAKASRKTNRRR